MKFLIATGVYPPDIGGPAKYAQKIVEELTRRGTRPRLLVWGALERVLPFGLRHAVYFLRLMPRVIGVDAVLALDTWSVGVPAVCAGKLFGKKTLVRIGGDPLWENYIERTHEMVRLSDFYKTPHSFTLKEKFIRAATRFLVGHADVLLFNTSWQMQIWQHTYGFANAKACLLENEYAVHKEEVAAPGDKKIFVAAGRGIVYKNIPAFTRAFAGVAKNRTDIELDTRALPSQEHLARVAKSYAVVVPSISEVNSNLIIEGLRFGKPFVASTDSGMREKLQNLGVFVDTLDQVAMKRAIETLLEPETYQKYVENIRAFNFTHTWSDIVDEIVAAAK